MTDLNVRSDSVDVEQIMKQIRARIREKRGADYTDAELQHLASVKLEQFADPSGLRSDLLEQFRKRGDSPSTYHHHRGWRRWILMLLHPLLKGIKKQLMADLNLYFEIIHNLVIEVTRLGIEVHNLKMRVESLSSRIDFDERRAKALEGVVQYRRGSAGSSGSSGSAGSAAGSSGSAGSAGSSGSAGSAGAPGVAAPGGPQGQGGPGRGDGEQRRRRRRRRRRPGQTMANGQGAGAPNGQPRTEPDGGDSGNHGGGDDGPSDDHGDNGADDQ